MEINCNSAQRGGRSPWGSLGVCPPVGPHPGFLLLARPRETSQEGQRTGCPDSGEEVERLFVRR